MRIDAHQHFWQLSRDDYGWLTPDLAPLYRDYMPKDLQPLLGDAGINGTIVVQAAPTVAETRFLLDLAQDHGFILGIVGWVDFEAPDVTETIESLAQNPALVGLRPMVQDIPDIDWILKPELAPAFRTLIDHDLVFDALTLPQHLGNLRQLLAQYPELRTVIDHASKPCIRDRVMEGWAENMAALARDTASFCKLSGLVTEAGPDWTVSELKPYVDHLLNTFGPERLIWGSDWPVCTLVASYAQWQDASLALLEGCIDEDRTEIFGGTAQHAYNIGI